ncbi:MAG: relaxase, partial [Clostridiales bacterium]|nr:relaxase [Clostridiales bacterium]
MATTAIVPIHAGSRNVAKALKDVTDYMADPVKTDYGAFVSSYKCAPETADKEFYLAKEKYLFHTNRKQGAKDVIAYHARQSFLPGEVTPE